MEKPVSDTPATMPGPITRFLCASGGADNLNILRQCPQDWGSLRAIGLLLSSVTVYQTAVLAIVSHRLFAAPGQLRLDLVFGAAFIAALVLQIDSYGMRTGLYLNGLKELKRGGIDIAAGAAFWITVKIAYTFRFLLAGCFAPLTALIAGLSVYASDLQAYIEPSTLNANAALIAQATARVDANIARATEAVSEQTKYAATLSAQVTSLRENSVDHSGDTLRQAEHQVDVLVSRKTAADDEVQRSEAFASNELAGVKGAPGNSGQVGNGPRRKAALEQVASARHAAEDAGKELEAARARLNQIRTMPTPTKEATKQAEDQITASEFALAARNEKLERLKNDLAALIRGRNDAIREDVEHAPNYVRPDNGLLAQIRALEAIAHADGKIASFIVLVDIAAFFLEVAAVFARVTSCAPTTYSVLLARDTFTRVVALVADMATQLHIASPAPECKQPASRDKFANDNLIASIFGPPDDENPDDSPPKPPKRPRGRPRKNTLN